MNEKMKAVEDEWKRLQTDRDFLKDRNEASQRLYEEIERAIEVKVNVEPVYQFVIATLSVREAVKLVRVLQRRTDIDDLAERLVDAIGERLDVDTGGISESRFKGALDAAKAELRRGLDPPTEPSKKTITIWTYAYTPFVMGGNTHRAISTSVEGTGPYDLGRSYYGYVVQNPNTGRYMVAEASTGAIIGPSLEHVREDIENGDEVVMRRQINEASAVGKSADQLAPAEFWAKFKE